MTAAWISKFEAVSLGGSPKLPYTQGSPQGYNPAARDAKQDPRILTSHKNWVAVKQFTFIVTILQIYSLI